MKLKYLLLLSLVLFFMTSACQVQSQEKEYGVCAQTFIAVRGEINNESEQVTQLVFGDIYQILRHSENKKWAFIENEFDKYQGWIPTESIFSVSEEYYNDFDEQTHLVAADHKGFVMIKGKKINISSGSSLPFLEKGFIKIGTEKYPYKGKSQQLEKKYTSKQLLNIAQTYLGIPYLWGGKTNQGIDCSGFTQMVFKQNGFNLPRDSYQQAEVGKKVTLKEAQPGDVAFFQRKAEGEGKVVHVGIYLGEGKIIHADGKVRINALDETGIYRDDLGKHSHFLKFLRRME